MAKTHMALLAAVVCAPLISAGQKTVADSQATPNWIWLGQATRFAANNPGGSPSDLYATIPISTALAEGDELLIAVAARTESAATDDGRAIVGIRVQDGASTDKYFANNRFKVGPNWQLVRIRTRASQAIAAGNAEVALYLASGEQQVDIGPVYVLKTN